MPLIFLFYMETKHLVRQVPDALLFHVENSSVCLFFLHLAIDLPFGKYYNYEAYVYYCEQ